MGDFDFSNASEATKKRNPQFFHHHPQKTRTIDSKALSHLQPWDHTGVPEIIKSAGNGVERKTESERIVEQFWINPKKPVFVLFNKITFNIPGNRYTPDFIFLSSTDGFLHIVEVKGAIKGTKGRKNIQHKSTRDSKAKFRAARDCLPYFIWHWIDVVDGEYTENFSI